MREAYRGTKFTCDKCGAVHRDENDTDLSLAGQVLPLDWFRAQIELPVGKQRTLKQYEADLCSSCMADLRDFFEQDV